MKWSLNQRIISALYPAFIIEKDSDRESVNVIRKYEHFHILFSRLFWGTFRHPVILIELIECQSCDDISDCILCSGLIWLYFSQFERNIVCFVLVRLRVSVSVSVLTTPHHINSSSHCHHFFLSAEESLLYFTFTSSNTTILLQSTPGDS